MTTEELINKLLYEAEELKVREHVLESCKKIMDLNPKMEKYDALKLSFDNAKLHAGFFRKTDEHSR